MQKLEIWLGVLIAVLSLFSILFILSGVIPSPEYPDHYTYGRLSEFSELFLPLDIIMGLIVIGRGFYKYTLLQTLLGILVVAWGLVAWFWINLSFYDARTVYIKGSVVSSVLRNSLVVSPGVPLGLALIQVGKRKKRL